jgi:hypothetical protein
MAKAGEEIIWQTDSGREDVYRIGHGYQLERIIDDLSEAEWLEREFNTSYVPLADMLQARVERGTLDPEDRDWQLQQTETNIRNKAAMLFGAPNDELDDYARTWYES